MLKLTPGRGVYKFERLILRPSKGSEIPRSSIFLDSALFF